MHEKTMNFIVALWKAGIPCGCCLSCFRPMYDHGIAMEHGLQLPVSQEQRVAIVAALLEAGTTMDELRESHLVGRKGPEPLYSDKEIVEGRWSLYHCYSVNHLVEWVEARWAPRDSSGE